MRRRSWWWLLLPVFLLLVAALVKVTKREIRLGDDLRVLCLREDNLELVSVSKGRNMINTLKVSGEAELWIPEGLGWYRTDRLEKLLKQEKKLAILPKLAFYNFGFWPDEYRLLGKDEECLSNRVLWKRMKVLEFLAFKLNEDNYLRKDEEIKEIGEMEAELKEVVRRDFSENELLNNQIRVSVFNTSQSSGMANFVSDRLEWAGADVISTENSDLEMESGCLLRVGDLGVLESSLGKLIKVVWNCEVEERKEVLVDELELYVGEAWSEMIKYPSYVRSF